MEHTGEQQENDFADEEEWMDVEDEENWYWHIDKISLTWQLNRNKKTVVKFLIYYSWII